VEAAGSEMRATWYYIVQKFENPAALGTLSLPFLPLDGGIFNPKA
jgi:hypothetical protein